MIALPLVALLLSIGETGSGTGPGAAPAPILATSPATIVELRGYPERAVLATPYDTAQVLVQGLRADGMSVDLTRTAERLSIPECVELDEFGRLRPVADGEGTLRLAFEGRELTIPVQVQGLSTGYEPDFRVDVMPVLSKTGCNAGTCHGAAQGKEGFRLSLRGYDPRSDWRALTDELAGRRFNRASPADSLFLLKPSSQVPHQGGEVVPQGGPDWQLLRDWIAGGVRYHAEAPKVTGIRVHPEDPTLPSPGDQQQFAVIATYSDGSTRDVTAKSFLESSSIEIATCDPRGLVTTLRRGAAAILARYEGAYASTRLFVMGDRSGFTWQAPPQYNEIDRLVDPRLEAIQTQPSEVCTDAEFLRRVRLDLTGRLPTVAEVRTFLQDRRPSRTKRDELVDRLIGSVDFVDHWTNKWSDLLQVNPKFLGDEGARRLRQWVRTQVASNTPYDEFVEALLTGSGSTLENPPAAYYKVLRAPDVVMENTTQLFLGVRFNCNKCHDHPFERWTLDQHWQLASFFAQVERKDAPGSPRMPASTAMAAGEQPPAFEEIVSDVATGEIPREGGGNWEPHFPYSIDEEIPADLPRRQQLAQWLTSAQNPYFVRSTVNRVFSYFFGRGLIEPADDLRASNPPSHPALLDWLAEEFVRRDFDVRWLMETVCKSRVYQHSVRTNAWNEDDDVHFSHALARRLPAETLFDGVHQAAGSRPRVPGTRPGTRAVQLLGRGQDGADGFLGLFGRPPRESACECERATGLSLGQALNLVNGPTLAEAIRDPANALAELVAFEPRDSAVLEELSLRFLGRMPREDEAWMLETLDPARRETLGALSPELEKGWREAATAWEAKLPRALWEDLEWITARSAQGATITLGPDGVALVSGERPDKDTYSLVGSTAVGGITGVRLVALPDDSLPARGPGRADNGNFVLNRLLTTAVAYAAPEGALTAKFGAATASFSQSGWPVGEVLGAPEKGWAIMPQLGRRHEAVFELQEDLLPAAGGLLVFSLDQQHGTWHTLGRFQVQVTRSPRPIRHSGLPDMVSSALAVAPDQRSEAQKDAVHTAFLATRPDLGRQIRLHAVQDLAWAFANSPEFLFTH